MTILRLQQLLLNIYGKCAIQFESPEDSMIKTFDKENVLLRGMVLKNTEYVVCIALLTGNKTVALFGQSGPRLFSKKSKPKVSRLEN